MKGLLRVLAVSTAPATFTSHRTGGSLANDEGFHFYLDGAVAFNPIDGSGTLIQNANILNLKSVTPGGGVSIRNCAPKFFNCKLTGNATTGTVYILFTQGCGALVQNCLFTRIGPAVGADLRATTFKLSFNRFRGGYYSFYVGDTAARLWHWSGGFEDFLDGTKEAALSILGGSTPVPISNNFWNGRHRRAAGAGRNPVQHHGPLPVRPGPGGRPDRRRAQLVAAGRRPTARGTMEPHAG